MLPVNKVILHEKKSNSEVETTCSLSSGNNENNGAHGGNEVRIKLEPQENGNCSTITGENTRKRECAFDEQSPSKRQKSTSEENISKSAEDCNEYGTKRDDVKNAEIKNENVNGAQENTPNISEVSTSNIKSEHMTESNQVGDNENDDALPSSSNFSNSNSGDINPPDIKIEKTEASSTTRDSCRYGIRCYRRNPLHRIEEAHPGDNDYRRPHYPPPPKGTPDCPYGDRCYRRNPVHFEQFNHPPETDFERNYKNYRLRLRQRRQTQQPLGESDEDSDFEDPFGNDDGFDSDFKPTSSEDDDGGNGDDDNDDYDACDRAEE